MENLKINIIPFEHPVQELEIGFYKKEKKGYYSLWKGEYPQSFWDDFNTEMQDCDKLYTNFKDTIDCDFKATVDFTKNTRLAAHYYSRLIYDYFETLADVVNISFVKDVQVWFKDEAKSTTTYTSYKRFTIKVQFKKVTAFPELLLSYDGNTSVYNKSVAELDNFPPELINLVKFNKQVVKYELAEDAVKQHIEELYPILSNRIRDYLKIERPPFTRGNKYLPYYKNINDLYDFYLNSKEFRAIIPLAKEGFYQVPQHHIHKTSFNSNQLRFFNGTDIVPHNGMKNIGPYKASPHANVRFFFIYHKPDRKFAVKTLYNYFREGYKSPEGYLYFKPLKTYIKQPFIIDEDTSISFDNTETALSTVKLALLNLEKKPNTKYVAIYVTPVHKTETDEQKKMLYYQVKEELLKHNISSQVIYKENIGHKDFSFYLPNIAIALLAKIDGIPWRLDRDTKEELIVGVGAFTSLNHNIKYVASAFCFNNNGEFKGFDCFKANQTDLLAGTIGKQILKYVVDNGESAKRLIIHFYKKISHKELEPIMEMLNKLNLNIPVVIVTINKTTSEDNVAFDLDSKNLMPVSGTYLKIGWDQYLLFNNIRYKTIDLVTDNPFPVKLSFTSTVDHYFDDRTVIEELIDQVYQFSRMYWKSVKQQNLPVTIKYPEMAAEIFPFFEGDKLPDFGKNNLWFL